MFYRVVVLFAMLISLTSCFDEQDTGAKEVRWDRDTCDRCRMVLSSPYYAAQISYLPKGKKRTKFAKFDDIGCAIIWLEDKEFKDDANTKIWVANHKDKSWLDAKIATFVHTKTSPMEYGLGAQFESSEKGLNYEQAKAHVFAIEEKYNIHGNNSHKHKKTMQNKGRK